MGAHSPIVGGCFFGEHSAQMYYLLGALYPAVVYSGARNLTIRSAQKDLLKVVKDELDIKAAITSSRGKYAHRNSHCIELQGVSYLCERLRELGIAEKKEERRIPDVSLDRFNSHFVRGLFDECGYVAYKRDEHGRHPLIHFNFHEPLLGDLDALLKGVLGREPDETAGRFTMGDRKLAFGAEDSVFIGEYMYIDEDNENFPNNERFLFSPSRRKALYYDPNDCKVPKISRKIIKSNERIAKAKRLLLAGVRPAKVAGMVGYGRSNSFEIIFKTKTGMTPTEFIESERAITQKSLG